MEETIQFIYEEIRKYNVNISGQINNIFKPAKLAKQTPVVKNNFSKAINILTEQGILEEKENAHFLTELGFSEIYKQ